MISSNRMILDEINLLTLYVCWQCFDGETIRGGFEFLDLQEKTRFLDQYLQCLYNACTETFPNTNLILHTN